MPNSQSCPSILSLLDAHDCPYWRLHVSAVRAELESKAQRPLRRQNPSVYLHRSTRYLWRSPDTFASNANDMGASHKHRE